MIDLEAMATVTSATSAENRGTLHVIVAVAEVPAASSWLAAVDSVAGEAAVADLVCSFNVKCISFLCSPPILGNIM